VCNGSSKEEVKSHGWYTAKLRNVAVRFRRRIRKELGLDFLLQVADKLFVGRILEEKIFAVFLLKKLTGEFGDAEFLLFESWLPRISSWADHDALVHYLIAPMVVAKPDRTGRSFSLGKIAKPLASAGSLRRIDPGNTPKDVLCRCQALVRSTSSGRRRHGAKGTGLAAARNCQG
jgi:hypothetical protein